MTPWAIQSPGQFRPGGPPALGSAPYAADFNGTKLMGRDTSATRTADQTLACRFWNASTANYFWNRIAVQLAAVNGFSLSQNAHLLATLDIAMADAAIACWDAKYTYVFWRPVTAIPSLDDDGNAATDPDPVWLPLLTTPNHPEYPSGHSTVSGAAGAVLAARFGDASSFTLDSDVMGLSLWLQAVLYLCATWTVPAAVPRAPVILTEPTNMVVNAGGAAIFTVEAEGDPPLNYQWMHDGTTPLFGRFEQPVLYLGWAQGSHSGAYSVVAVG